MFDRNALKLRTKTLQISRQQLTSLGNTRQIGHRPAHSKHITVYKYCVRTHSLRNSYFVNTENCSYFLPSSEDLNTFCFVPNVTRGWGSAKLRRTCYFSKPTVATSSRAQTFLQR